MDMNKLKALDEELDTLEFDYDICLEQGLNKPDEIRLQQSYSKLRKIVRANTNFRKELLSQLQTLKQG
jgi:hypothetical protein